MSRKIKRLFTFALSMCIIPAWAQGENLCDEPDGSVLGDFEISIVNKCNPKQIEVNDLSGGENIRYNFVYQGQGAHQLSQTIPFTNYYDYGNGFLEPTKVTILQYGTKNGKPMYACRTHVLRQNNQAKFSYAVCDDGSLKYSIPADGEINDFDSYEVSTDNFVTTEVFSSSELPLTRTLNVQLPTRLFIRGKYNDPAENCNLDIRGKFIQNSTTTPTNGLNDPFYPQITSIVQDNNRLKLQILGSLDDARYSIFQRDINGNYPNVPEARGIAAGQTVITLDDPTNQKCFFIQNESTSCREESSAEVCSLPILDIQVANGSHTLQMGIYPEKLNGKENNPTSGNNLVVTQGEITREIDNQFDQRKVYAPTESEVPFIVFSCEKEHCYRARIGIEGQNEGIRFKSIIWSNEVCVNPNNQSFQLDGELTVSLVNGKTPQVEASAPENLEFPLKNFYLFHQQADGTFEKVDSTNQIPALFTTEHNGEEKSHCYKIQAQNQCNVFSEMSEAICSVHLEFENNASLKWTAENPFVKDIEEYVILTKGSTGNLDLNYDLVPASQNVYTPNLSLFEDEATFQIEAKNKIGSSFSNVVVKELDPKLFVSNAFTPNNDSYNNSWMVFGKKDRVRTFNLVVINRKGHTVYQTDDVNFQWQPISGELLNGIYYYKMVAILDNGNTISKEGQVTLLE